MPRPKKPLELQEGPQAFQNFQKLARQIIPVDRQTAIETEHAEQTTLTTEVHDVVVVKRRTRKK